MQGAKSRLKGITQILIIVVVSLGIAVTVFVGLFYLLALGVTKGPGNRAEERWSATILSSVILEPSIEWTPDGQHIVFTTPFSEFGEGSTYLMRTDGSEMKRISEGIGDRHVVEVGHDISQSGTRLVYLTSRHHKAKGFDLEVSKLDGSDRRRLTSVSETMRGAPEWSPDGTLIAYVHDRVRVITAGGQEKSTLKFPGDILFRSGPAHGPKWSPNGQAIAFVAPAGGFDEEPDIESFLYTVNHDGTNRREAFPILDTRRSPFTRRDSISPPSWSPDGKYLAFALNYEDAELEKENGLYIVRPDGTDLIRLTAWSDTVEYVDWSPDGEEILTGNGLIVNVNDGETHRVLPLGLSMRAVWSPDGSQMAVLTRGGQLIIADRDGSNRRNLTTGDG